MCKYFFLYLFISTFTQFAIADNDPYGPPDDEEISIWNTTLAKSKSVKPNEVWYQISLRDKSGTITQGSERPKDKKGYITFSETDFSLYDQYSKEIWKSKYDPIQNDSKKMDAQISKALGISVDRLNAIRRWEGFIRSNMKNEKVIDKRSVTSQETMTPASAVDMVSARLDSKVGITAIHLAAKDNPKGIGYFVFSNKTTRAFSTNQHYIWYVSRNVACPLNGPSKRATPAFEFCRDKPESFWLDTGMGHPTIQEAAQIVGLK